MFVMFFTRATNTQSKFHYRTNSKSSYVYGFHLCSLQLHKGLSVEKASAVTFSVCQASAFFDRFLPVVRRVAGML
jgi:hypothetical protein